MIAPASTGRDSNSKRAVIPTDQTNSGTRLGTMPSGRIFMMVVMKLMAPRIEEIPARCKEKILISTDALLWAKFLDSGG